MSKKTRIISALGLSLACYFYFTISSELYLSSDNVMVAIVTNGLFSTNPFCQYLHPLLCLLIRGVAMLVPSADAFTVLKDAFIFGELALAFYILTAPLTTLSDGQPSHEGKRGVEHYLILAVAVMVDVFLSMGINLWRANYTITAGSFAAMGVALLLTGKRYGHPRWRWIGAVYLAFGFMLRRECGLLAMPFLALHIVADLFTSPDYRTELRALSRSVLPALIIIATLLTSQALFYSREPYVTAERYNDYRTICVDYPMKSWTATDYPDRATYMAATNWYFIDTDNMTAETFEAVADAGSRNQYGFNLQGVFLAAQEMRKIAFHTDVYMMVGVTLALLLMIWNLITARGIWRRMEALLAIIGAFIILFYFTIRGRAPLRVWQPVLFASLVLEALIYLDSWKANLVNVISMLVVAVLLYYSAGQVIAHAKLHAPITAWTSRIGADESKYEDTFSGIYIWPSWHGAVPRQFAVQNKLPTKRVLEHNIAAGDWTYGQPYYNEFLSRIGVRNPAEALVDGKAFIIGNNGIVESYLQEQYGEDIILVGMGFEVYEKEAYKVERR